jgi:hypothetical protein
MHLPSARADSRPVPGSRTSFESRDGTRFGKKSAVLFHCSPRDGAMNWRSRRAVKFTLNSTSGINERHVRSKNMNLLWNGS